MTSIDVAAKNNQKKGGMAEDTILLENITFKVIETVLYARFLTRNLAIVIFFYVSIRLPVSLPCVIQPLP